MSGKQGGNLLTQKEKSRILFSPLGDGRRAEENKGMKDTRQPSVQDAATALIPAVLHCLASQETVLPNHNIIT